MLKKMGWEEGEGIGKHKQGDANPLTLEIKFDKKGLMAAEEEKRGSVSQTFPNQIIQGPSAEKLEAYIEDVDLPMLKKYNYDHMM